MSELTLTLYWLPSLDAVCPVSARFVLVAPDTLENLPDEDVLFCHWNVAVPLLVTDATTANVAAPLEVVLSVLFVDNVIVFAASATSVSSESSPDVPDAACTNARCSAL